MGHQHPVIYLSHIGNGKDMVTIDQEGHILVWTYAKDRLDADSMFTPSGTYKLSLKSQVRKQWLGS